MEPARVRELYYFLLICVEIACAQNYQLTDPFPVYGSPPEALLNSNVNREPGSTDSSFNSPFVPNYNAGFPSNGDGPSYQFSQRGPESSPNGAGYFSGGSPTSTDSPNTAYQPTYDFSAPVKDYQSSFPQNTLSPPQPFPVPAPPISLPDLNPPRVSSFNPQNQQNQYSVPQQQIYSPVQQQNVYQGSAQQDTTNTNIVGQGQLAGTSYIRNNPYREVRQRSPSRPTPLNPVFQPSQTRLNRPAPEEKTSPLISDDRMTKMIAQILKSSFPLRAADRQEEVTDTEAGRELSNTRTETPAVSRKSPPQSEPETALYYDPEDQLEYDEEKDTTFANRNNPFRKDDQDVAKTLDDEEPTMSSKTALYQQLMVQSKLIKEQQEELVKLKKQIKLQQLHMKLKDQYRNLQTQKKESVQESARSLPATNYRQKQSEASSYQDQPASESNVNTQPSYATSNRPPSASRSIEANEEKNDFMSALQDILKKNFESKQAQKKNNLVMVDMSDMDFYKLAEISSAQAKRKDLREYF